MRKCEVYYDVSYIDRYIARNNISKSEFARRCGISLVTLNKIYACQNVRYRVLMSLVQVLDVSPSILLGIERD